jgi:archaellum component FlaC
MINLKDKAYIPFIGAGVIAGLFIYISNKGSNESQIINDSSGVGSGPDVEGLMNQQAASYEQARQEDRAEMMDYMEGIQGQYQASLNEYQEQYEESTELYQDTISQYQASLSQAEAMTQAALNSVDALKNEIASINSKYNSYQSQIGTISQQVSQYQKEEETYTIYAPPGDMAAAQEAAKGKSNVIVKPASEFNPNANNSNAIVAGGLQAEGGISNSGNATRIGGANRDETGQKLKEIVLGL